MLLQQSNVPGGLRQHGTLGAFGDHDTAAAEQIAEFGDLLGNAKGALLFALVALFALLLFNGGAFAVVVAAASVIGGRLDGWMLQRLLVALAAGPFRANRNATRGLLALLFALVIVRVVTARICSVSGSIIIVVAAAIVVVVVDTARFAFAFRRRQGSLGTQLITMLVSNRLHDVRSVVSCGFRVDGIRSSHGIAVGAC